MYQAMGDSPIFILFVNEEYCLLPFLYIFLLFPKINIVRFCPVIHVNDYTFHIIKVAKIQWIRDPRWNSVYWVSGWLGRLWMVATWSLDSMILFYFWLVGLILIRAHIGKHIMCLSSGDPMTHPEWVSMVKLCSFYIDGRLCHIYVLCNNTVSTGWVENHWSKL